MGRGEEEHGSLRAVELRGPRETVHGPKGWEAQGWSWYLQVLAGWALPQLQGSQGIAWAWEPRHYRGMCDPSSGLTEEHRGMACGLGDR